MPELSDVQYCKDIDKHTQEESLLVLAPSATSVQVLSDEIRRRTKWNICQTQSQDSERWGGGFSRTVKSLLELQHGLKSTLSPEELHSKG